MSNYADPVHVNWCREKVRRHCEIENGVGKIKATEQTARDYVDAEGRKSHFAVSDKTFRVAMTELKDTLKTYIKKHFSKWDINSLSALIFLGIPTSEAIKTNFHLYCKDTIDAAIQETFPQNPALGAFSNVQNYPNGPVILSPGSGWSQTSGISNLAFLATLSVAPNLSPLPRGPLGGQDVKPLSPPAWTAYQQNHAVLPLAGDNTLSVPAPSLLPSQTNLTNTTQLRPSTTLLNTHNASLMPPTSVQSSIYGLQPSKVSTSNSLNPTIAANSTQASLANMSSGVPLANLSAGNGHYGNLYGATPPAANLGAFPPNLFPLQRPAPVASPSSIPTVPTLTKLPSSAVLDSLANASPFSPHPLFSDPWGSPSTGRRIGSLITPGLAVSPTQSPTPFIPTNQLNGLGPNLGGPSPLLNQNICPQLSKDYYCPANCPNYHPPSSRVCPFLLQGTSCYLPQCQYAHPNHINLNKELDDVAKALGKSRKDLDKDIKDYNIYAEIRPSSKPCPAGYFKCNTVNCPDSHNNFAVLTATGLKPLGNPSYDLLDVTHQNIHLSAVDSVFQRSREYTFTYKKITLINNPSLLTRFTRFKEAYENSHLDGRPSDVVRVLHGTKPAGFSGIPKDGFNKKYSVRNLLGDGHYFSLLPDSAHDYSAGNDLIVICDILEHHQYYSSSGFYVVTDDDAILPLYLVEYTAQRKRRF